MRRRSRQLADLLVRTVTGPMWHGEALGAQLARVSPQQARARPIAGAHSIWELVLHISAWAEIARARVHGAQTEDPAPDEDWPPLPEATGEQWAAAIEKLHESYRALASDVGVFDDEALDQPVRHLNYSLATMLHGIVEHGTYHGGQIALLKRASAPA